MRLATPYGLLLADGAADISGGRGCDAPTCGCRRRTLRGSAAAVVGLGGTVTARAVGGDALALQARLVADRIDDGPRRATDGRRVTADALLPYRSALRSLRTGGCRSSSPPPPRRSMPPGAAAKTATGEVEFTGALSTRGGVAFDGTLTAKACARPTFAPAGRACAGRPHPRSARLTTGAAPGLEGRAAVLAAGGAATRRSRANARRWARSPSPLTEGRRGEAALGRSRDAPRRRPPGCACRLAGGLAGRWAPGPYGADLRPALAAAAFGAERCRCRRGRLAASERGLARGARACPRRSRAAELRADAGGGARAEQGGRRSVRGGCRTARGGGLSEARVAVPALPLRPRRAGRAAGPAAVQGSAGPLSDAPLALPADLPLDRRGVRLSAARCGEVVFDRFMGDKASPWRPRRRGGCAPAQARRC